MKPKKKQAKPVETQTKPRVFQPHVCQSMEEFLNTPGPEMTEEEWEAAKLQTRSLSSPPIGASKKSSRP